MDSPGVGRSEPPAEAALVRSLRRLDRPTFARLLRDLYRERRWEADLEDGLVVATRDSGQRRQVILPVAGRWSLPDDALRSDRRVDVVVTTGDTTRAARLASRLDADCLSGADVAGMLRYAVDRRACDAICRAHLGRAPEEMRPPLAHRVRERVDRVKGPMLVALAVVLFVGGVALVAAAVFPTVDPGETRTPEPAGSQPADRVARLADGGRLDVDGLAAAHRAALGNRPFRQRRQVMRSGGATGDAEPVIRRRVAAVGASTFRVRASTSGERRQSGRELYFDGANLYEAQLTGSGFSYREITTEPGPVGPAAPIDPGRVVERYLGSPHVTVSGPHTIDGSRAYRIEARGTPRALASIPLRNYSAEATVTPRGLVRQLTVSYNRSANGTRRVFVSVRHELTPSPPRPPRWYVTRWGGNATTAGGPDYSSTSSRRISPTSSSRSGNM